MLCSRYRAYGVVGRLVSGPCVLTRGRLVSAVCRGIGGRGAMAGFRSSLHERPPACALDHADLRGRGRRIGGVVRLVGGAGVGGGVGGGGVGGGTAGLRLRKAPAFALVRRARGFWTGI